jgi:hypothetical protein
MRDNPLNPVLSARKYMLRFGLIIACMVAVIPASCAAAGAISQGYRASSDGVSKGALLSVVSKGSNEIEPANNNNAYRLVGVAAEKPLVDLSSNGENTRVVVSGSTQVLVSDMNGSVKTGDKIAVSPVAGIGMKAVQSSQIIGTAQANFDSTTTVSQAVAGTDGKAVDIKVALLPVAVNVAYYSASMSQGGAASFVPPFLQSLANTVVGKQVSPLRVLLSATALLMGFVAAMVILYTSVRNGLISLGRNPLAQKALRRGLIDVIIAAIALLVVTAGTVYAIMAL